jgi:molybdate transport system substrate-binding protein
MANNISIITSMATRQILSALISAYSDDGLTPQLQSVGGVEAARRIRAGEKFDIVVLSADALAALANEGHVIRDTVRVFALSPTAVAVPVGIPHAGHCDEASLKALIAGGKRIALSTGPSGKSIAQLLHTWAASGSAKNPITLAPSGVPVAHLLVRGEADIGFQQLSEFLDEPGISIVGSLSTGLQPMTAFSCGIARHTSNMPAAQKIIAALLADTAAASKRRGGMESPQ